MGDQLSFGKRNLVNFVVKYVKKLVPKYKLPNAVTFREVLSIGKFRQYVRPQIDREYLAFLQYTGGTTGVAKGAMLTHGSIIPIFSKLSGLQSHLLAIMLSNVLSYWLYRFIMSSP